MKKGLQFKVLYVATGAVPMLVIGLAVCFLGLNLMKTKIVEGETATLKASALSLAEYFAYDIRENGVVDYEEYSDHEYVDSLKSLDVEQTLFQGNTRFLSSLKNSDGSYYENTQASEEVWNVVSSGKEYVDESVNINGVEYCACYVPVFSDKEQTKVWGMAFAGVPTANVTKSINSAGAKLLILIFTIIIIFSIALLLCGKMYTGTLKRIEKDVKYFAAGNAWHKNSITSVCVEFGEIGKSLNELTDRLGSAVDTITETSDNLEVSVSTVDSLAEENASGVNKISQVVNELSETATSMAEKVQDANTSVIRMGDSIDSITELTSEAAEKSEIMSNENKTALDSMSLVLESNEKSVEVISKINLQAEECSSSVENIRSAADVIADIASQTNLLALNASIEAARAGDAGRGFAVVAENIRALAEQSTASAQEIGMNVQDVVAKVKVCAEMAVHAKGQMEEQQSLVKEVAGGIDRLGEAVKVVAENIEAVSGEADSLNEAKSEVLESILGLSAISEENAASSEEVTATIEDMANSISSTSDQTREMNKMAEILKENLSFFNKVEV